MQKWRDKRVRGAMPQHPTLVKLKRLNAWKPQCLQFYMGRVGVASAPCPCLTCLAGAWGRNARFTSVSPPVHRADSALDPCLLSQAHNYSPRCIRSERGAATVTIRRGSCTSHPRGQTASGLRSLSHRSAGTCGKWDDMTSVSGNKFFARNFSEVHCSFDPIKVEAAPSCGHYPHPE